MTTSKKMAVSLERQGDMLSYSPPEWLQTIPLIFWTPKRLVAFLSLRSERDSGASVPTMPFGSHAPGAPEVG